LKEFPFHNQSVNPLFPNSAAGQPCIRPPWRLNATAARWQRQVKNTVDFCEKLPGFSSAYSETFGAVIITALMDAEYRS
jgi:hypothetical protein